MDRWTLPLPPCRCLQGLTSWVEEVLTFRKWTQREFTMCYPHVLQGETRRHLLTHFDSYLSCFSCFLYYIVLQPQEAQQQLKDAEGEAVKEVSKVATLSSQFARRWAHFLPPTKLCKAWHLHCPAVQPGLDPGNGNGWTLGFSSQRKKHVNMSHCPTISVVVGNQRIPEKSIAPPTHSAILSFGSSFGSSPRPYHLSRI